MSHGRQWLEDSGSEDSPCPRPLGGRHGGRTLARRGAPQTLLPALRARFARGRILHLAPRLGLHAPRDQRVLAVPPRRRASAVRAKRARAEAHRALEGLRHRGMAPGSRGRRPTTTPASARPSSEPARPCPTPRPLDIGLKSLRWLASLQTTREGHFRPIGSEGFYERGGGRADFDQQPVEAQAMVSASLEAFRATKDGFWREEAKRAFEWFLGPPTTSVSPLYDSGTGGCGRRAASRPG